MNLQLTLAARYLVGRKLRTVLTTLAIIFGVVLIFGMNTVLPTLVAALQANVQGAEGEVDFTVTNLSGEAFPEDVVNRLHGIDGIRAMAASLQRTINLPANFVDRDPSHPDTVTAVNLVGIVPEEARSLRSYPVLAGRYLNDLDTASTVISQTLADALSVGVGDTFALPTASGMTELTVVGILPADLSSANEKVLVNLPQAQLMTNEPGKVNIIDLDVDAFADQTQRAEIQTQIEAALGKNYQVGGLVTDDQLFAAIDVGRIAFNLFGFLALFMGGFIIFNTFRTVVTERRRDIGMLRALGATRRTVIGIVLAEGLLQGLVGSLIGLLLGYLLAVGVINIAQGPISMFINLKLGTPVFSPALVGVSIFLGVGVTVLAGLLPAWNASRITPLEALRPSQAEGEFKRQTGVGFVLGVVTIVITAAAILSGNAALIVPGGILFLVGLVLIAPVMVRPFASLFGKITVWATIKQGIGGLAQSNLTRQPARVAVTASASMIGLAVIVAAGGLVSSMSGTIFDWMRYSFGSDYLFVPPSIALWGGNVGADPSFAESLRQVPGVEAVSTLRFASSNLDGMAVSMMGIQPIAFEQVSGLYFTKGNKTAYAKLASGRNMIVNPSFVLATGKGVGDTVELLTADGRVPYTIVAEGSDILNAKVTTAYISQANLAADFGTIEDVFLQLNLKPGADRAAADKQIRALAYNYPQFKVVSGNEYVGSLETQASAAFSAVYILFAILAFPSLIAMLNTLTIGVLERTREIGMIRAVGATRRQVRNMIVVEALLLAAIGTAFGILGGLYLGYVFVTGIKIIFPLGYFFPASGILAAIAFGLLFGVLAAIIPARQAARMDVVAALRYE
jgi:putative ABC transport system permease protein